MSRHIMFWVLVALKVAALCSVIHGVHEISSFLQDPHVTLHLVWGGEP